MFGNKKNDITPVNQKITTDLFVGEKLKDLYNLVRENKTLVIVGITGAWYYYHNYY